MEMDSADKRGRVRKKSAKAREMEEFEEEERKHGGKKGVETKPSTVLSIPTTPPTPTKKIQLNSDSPIEDSDSPVSKGAMSSGVNLQVSPQPDPQGTGSVIKLLLSSPVRQSPPTGGKPAKKDSPKDLHAVSEAKPTIKGRKLNIGDGTDVSASSLKLRLDNGGKQTLQTSKQKNVKAAEELPPLSVDTNVQSETIGDEGSLKMKFILSPKEKVSDSSKKIVNVQKPSNEGLITMLKSGSAGIEKRKILKTKRTDMISETGEGVKATGLNTTAQVVKKAGSKRKLEQTVIIKTNPSSSVEYSLPADQKLDYMDLSSFDFDEEGELIISDDNKTKKLIKKPTKSSPKKIKQSHPADNEFSLDDSHLASSDVAELAKRVKTAAERKMGKKVKKGKSLKEDAKMRKEKKKRPPTAYMLWCNYYRQKVVSETPGLDFIQISKRLGELWQNLPDKEKLSWKNKAKKNAGKGSTLISTGKTGGSRTGPPPGVTSQTATTTTTPTVVKVLAPAAPPKAKQSPEDPLSPIKGFGTEPVDVAAHLKLVGESLCIIGVRLQEHRGLIAVQGSLSVLLDSMLCALGPLMCLTQQLPELNGCPKQVHSKTLDNVAYIMPGL